MPYFRASGSGDIVYEVSRIRPQCSQVACEVTRKIGLQSMAFDFVLAANQQPMLVEVIEELLSMVAKLCG
jgi:hypothetical protein